MLGGFPSCDVLLGPHCVVCRENRWAFERESQNLQMRSSREKVSTRAYSCRWVRCSPREPWWNINRKKKRNVRKKYWHPDQILTIVPYLIGRQEHVKQETVTNDSNCKSSIELSRANVTERLPWNTYIPPPMKTSMTPSLPFQHSRSRQTIGMGKMKMKRSDIMFIEP